MLIEFDQNTIANMTAALDYVCKKIPADRDSNELRKRIADELIQCAQSGKRTVIDLQNAGLNVLEFDRKADRLQLVRPKTLLFPLVIGVDVVQDYRRRES